MSNKKKPLTKDENQQLAEGLLQPIMMMLDIAIAQFDIERIRMTIANMRSQTSIARALPFPETQAKADANGYIVEIFDKVIDIMELRKKQMTGAENRKKQEDGMDTLRKLGLA